MKKYIKVLSSILLLLSISIVLAGCSTSNGSSDNKNVQQKSSSTNNKTGKIINKNVFDITNFTSDTDNKNADTVTFHSNINLPNTTVITAKEKVASVGEKSYLNTIDKKVVRINLHNIKKGNPMTIKFYGNNLYLRYFNTVDVEEYVEITLQNKDKNIDTTITKDDYKNNDNDD